MSTVTTNDFPTVVREFMPGEVIPDALVLQTSTDTGVTVEGDAVAVSVPLINADDDAGFVAEGAPINEADPDVSQTVIFTGKVAELGAVSTEQWLGGDVASLMSTAFQRAIIKKANFAYLSQALPVAPAVTPPGGILSQPITDGGSVAADLDSIIDAMAVCEQAFGEATHVLASPTSWASLVKRKVGTGSNQSLLGAGTAEAGRQLLGKPVLTSPAVPAGTLVVVDKAAILHVAGPVRVATSEHAAFNRDSVLLRVTFRFGAKLIDASGVVKLTISDES